MTAWHENPNAAVAFCIALEAIRSGAEGNTVEVFCDNPDAEVLDEQTAVAVCADFTEWKVVRFYGRTPLEAILAAGIEQARWRLDDWWKPRTPPEGVKPWSFAYDFGGDQAVKEIRFPVGLRQRLRCWWKRLRGQFVPEPPAKVLIEASTYNGPLARGEEPPADSWFVVWDGEPRPRVLFSEPVEARYFRVEAA